MQDPVKHVESEAENRQAEELQAVPPRVVHETVRKNGEEELRRSNSALAWSGLAAGLSMGFSFVAQALLFTYLPDSPWRPLVAGLGYPVGFLIVIMGRQQLFTENTLTPVIPLLAHPDRATLLNVLRLWAVVFTANIAGAHLFAWTIAKTGALRPEIHQTLIVLAREAADVTFGAALLRGVFAGWLIALVVWMVAATEHSPFPVIFILTYIVGLGRFTHVIAGSVDVLFLVMSGAMPWWSFLSGFLIPALLGNVIGGVALVSALNHAQVVSGEEGSGGAGARHA